MNAFVFTFILVFIEFIIVVAIVSYVVFDRYMRKKQLGVALSDFSLMLNKESDIRKDSLTRFLKESLEYGEETLEIVRKDILKAEESFNKSFLLLYSHDKIDASTLKLIREEYIHIVSLYQSLLPQTSSVDIEEDIEEFNLAPEEVVKEEVTNINVQNSIDRVKKECKVKLSTYLESKGLTVGEVKSELKEIIDKYMVVAAEIEVNADNNGKEAK